jgi:hypothetical protein
VKDRRAGFFALAAVLCFVLVPVAQSDYRELTAGVGAVYVLLAIASLLDFRSRH